MGRAALLLLALAVTARGADPLPGDSALTLAAEALERGDEPAAAARMREYVTLNPTAVMPRAHLAELLFRQHRTAEARREYERFVADAQPQTGSARRHLVHAHTRLMALAQDARDGYAEALHRGVGLYWVAERDPPDAATEPTLTKALVALNEARERRPCSARANAYVARVCAALGQPAAARAAARRGRDCLPDATLTATERRWLDDLTE
jgi:hypothetical protein